MVRYQRGFWNYAVRPLKFFQSSIRVGLYLNTTVRIRITVLDLISRTSKYEGEMLINSHNLTP